MSKLGAPPKVIPEYTGLQVNTAVQVLPIPIIWGKPRCNMNLIYYNGFYSKLVSQGGKGLLGGGKGGGQSVEYFATLIMAIGEGPLTAIDIIYQDQATYTPSDYPTNGAYFFEGTPTQLPWTVISGAWPADARSYKDTSYYGFYNAQLDSSATVPQINIVPAGRLAGTCPLNKTGLTITSGQYNQQGNPLSFFGTIELGFADADPAQVIIEFLTDPTFGAGFSPQFLDFGSLLSSPEAFDPSSGDTALSTFCQAVGLGWSLVLNNAESANSILDRWTKNLNVAVVWNGVTLRFIPYWDQFNGLNPGWDVTAGIAKKYFSPYTQPICSITYDHVLQSEDKANDPITFSRKDPMQVYNTVRIDYKDRTNFFNDNSVEAKDEAQAELIGPRIDNIGLANEFTLTAYANVAAQMQLQRNISIRRNFQWKMSPLWGWLQPMDVVQIPNPANLSQTLNVRITSVEDDEDETVTVTAEEFPYGGQSPVVIPTSTTTPPNQGATNFPALPVFPPVIFEPTTLMLTATGFAVPQVIIGASGGSDGTLNAYWGGCYVWLSTDNVNYEMFATLMQQSLVGLLAASVGASGTTIQVNMDQSEGVLNSVSAAGAAAGASLCVMKDASGIELFSYTSAILTGPGVYTLSGLFRGLYGTTQREFGAGSQFLFCGTSGNFIEKPLPPQYVGTLFYVKLQSFNSFHNQTQDLATCAVYEYLLQGPTPVGPVPAPMAPPRRGRSNSTNESASRRKAHGLR